MTKIKLYILISFVAVSMTMVSCDKNDVPSEKVQVQLEVNANNISGQWQLVSWNGEELIEGTYMYMDIVRNGKTYTIYQNMDSFADIPHVVTGVYAIYEDVRYGSVIRGNYDHDAGDWAHRYVITSLTEDEMLWVAKDDSSFTQLFVRVEDIPVD